MFKIEKNVPMPTQFRDKAEGYSGMYPFEEMDKGDSFLITCSPVLRENTRSKVYSAAMQYKKRWDEHFSLRTRIVKDGIRVWCASSVHKG